MMTQETAGSIIRQIRVTFSHLQLYPPGSAMVLDSTKQLMTLLETSWQESPEVLLGETDRQLLVNGNRFGWKGPDQAAAEALINRLQTHHVKSIGFKQGMPADELAGFLALLAKKPGTGEEALGAQVKAQGFTHVVLNEKVFVVAGEDTPPAPQTPPTGPTAPAPAPAPVTAKTPDAPATPPPMAPKPISPVDAAKALLAQDPGKMLTDENVKALPDMLKSLDKMEQPKLAGEMVDQLATNLDSPDADIRLKTAQSFKSVTSAVEGLSDKNVIEKLENRFMEAGERETAKPVYNELADLLERGADRVLGEGNYEKTLRIVGMFRRHTSTKDAGFIDRWLCAQRALERIGNRHAVEILVTDLRAEDAGRRDQAYTVIMKLADAALGELIEAVHDTEDIHLRRVIAYAIKNIGEDAVTTYIDGIATVTNPEHGKRMVEVLEGLGQEGMAPALIKVFDRCLPAVKIEILKVLTRMRVAEAEGLIIQAMDDGDRKVRVGAIELSGKLHAKSAVAKLLPLIAFQSRFARVDEDDETQEMACRALGAIGDPQAVPVLLELATGAPFMKRVKSDPVRSAAVLALGEFVHEEGKRAVDQALQIKDPAVKQAAEQAKKRQTTKIQKKGDRLAATVL